MYEVTYVKTENDKPSRLFESVNSILDGYIIFIYLLLDTPFI